MDIPIESLAQFLAFRQKYSSEVFSKFISDDTIRLCMPYRDVGWLFCDVDATDPIYLALQGTFNIPIEFVTKRIYSHDFGDTTTWADPQNSKFTISAQSIQHPVYGALPSRWVIYKILVRFPKNANFESGNHASFRYYRSLDGMTPVDENTPMLFNVEYETLGQLLTESETEIEMTADVIDGVYNTSMVQAEFLFCDPFTLLGKPIILRQTLGDHLDVQFELDQPVKDKNGDVLTDPCFVVFLCNEMIAF